MQGTKEIGKNNKEQKTTEPEPEAETETNGKNVRRQIRMRKITSEEQKSI